MNAPRTGRLGPPIGTDGFEFIEFAAHDPTAMGKVL